MSLALYRKYRPKKLDDLLGQEGNMLILKNAAKAGRFAHAYLFYGPRGTGKTTTARLIAKLLNCEKRRASEAFKKTGEPCNDCRHCTEIDAQNSFDVVEIDAASNRGIEEIRDLKENIKNLPASGDFRVYIIDEAHMLTTQAFNALLKTLEEPPAHAVFILATTEYEKLPATIVSRVQRFLFKKPAKMKIMEKLTDIARAEKIKIDTPALELIASAAEGSFRDAESLLDQIASLEEHVDLRAVEHATGRIGFKKVRDLADAVLDRDIKSALMQIAAIQSEGGNLVETTKDLIHYIRKALSLLYSPDLKAAFGQDLTEEEISHLVKLGARMKPELITRLLQALIRAYTEMRYSPFATVPLEIALIEHLGETQKK